MRADDAEVFWTSSPMPEDTFQKALLLALDTCMLLHACRWC